MAKKRFDLPSEEDKKKVSFDGLKKTVRLFQFIKPYRVQFFLGFVFLIISGLTSLIFPFVTGKLVDSAMGITKKWDRNVLALGLMGVLSFQAVFSFARVQFFAQVSEKAMRDIRNAFYRKLLVLPISFYDKRRVGELTSRLTADVSQLQDVLSFTLAEFIRQITTLLVGVGIILVTSLELTLVMISSFPLMVIGAVIFGKFIRKISKKVSDELAKANVVAEETLQNIHSVKAFSNEAYESARYGKSLYTVVGYALKASLYRGSFISFIIFAIFGGIVFVLWYGLGMVAQGEITIGDLVSFIIYTSFIGAAAGGMGDLYGQLQKTIGSAERILEIMDQEDVEGEISIQRPKLKVSGHIQFEDVHFQYPTRTEHKVLKGINFELPSGSKVALVGQSGAGKSTIVQLLLRYYDPGSGLIKVDGKPISSYDIFSYRDQIAIVPQEVILFGGTIKENIAYGKPNASNEEILEAARQANALEFIQKFPDQLETIVGERGIKLSGGQRQRIAIARAILKDPAILILDEATSALDAESESLVQEALDLLMEKRTTIIIAHRLATVRKADTIYVLQDGKIVEQGAHEALFASEGAYQKLVKLQFELT